MQEPMYLTLHIVCLSWIGMTKKRQVWMGEGEVSQNHFASKIILIVSITRDRHWQWVDITRAPGKKTIVGYAVIEYWLRCSMMHMLISRMRKAWCQKNTRYICLIMSDLGRITSNTQHGACYDSQPSMLFTKNAKGCYRSPIRSKSTNARWYWKRLWMRQFTSKCVSLWLHTLAQLTVQYSTLDKRDQNTASTCTIPALHHWSMMDVAWHGLWISLMLPVICG